jgi:hypothetical protein
MADRDAILLEPARDFYNRCSSQEQQRLDRVLDDICDSPEPDYVLRFLLDAPPDFPFYYRDDEYVIVYEEVNAWTIEVWGIQRTKEDVVLDPRRPT